jgi:hypothetical protein
LFDVMVLPAPVEARQGLAGRRLDARGRGESRQELPIALAGVPPHDAAHRALASSVVASMATVRPFSSPAATRRSCTHVKTARWVSTSISRRVREIVE